MPDEQSLFDLLKRPSRELAKWLKGQKLSKRWILQAELDNKKNSSK